MDDASAPTYPDAVFILNDKSEWRCPLPLLEALRGAYQALDAEATLKQAAAWALANQANRKTRDGMPKFLHRWFAREQNDARPAGPAVANGHRADPGPRHKLRDLKIE